MFGIYTNQRMSEAERNILNQHPDDYNWYCIYLWSLFKDQRFFQVREDIELPQSEDDNGVVLMFQDGDVVYFKTIDGDADERVIQSTLKVCLYLEDLFKRDITAYVVCPSDAKIEAEKVEGEGNVRILFSLLKNTNGEEIIERLESKLKNHEEFSIPDSIDHMLLPYMGFKNKRDFKKKFKQYMDLVNEYGGCNNA